MAILPIQKGADHPMLRRKAQKVLKVTKAIQKLIRDMRQTVQSADGAGIAAPQVGTSLAVCLAMIQGKMMPLINPEITWKSEETNTEEEGCLSLPGVTVPVTRPREITVKYVDGRGASQEHKLTGFDARTVQHEVDHLNGVLIVDYLMIPGKTAKSS
jgi:peptide deformylase